MFGIDDLKSLFVNFCVVVLAFAAITSFFMYKGVAQDQGPPIACPENHRPVSIQGKWVCKIGDRGMPERVSLPRLPRL
jgi:hypothetical protein